MASKGQIRIIAGLARGRRLVVPNAKDLRPTTDRIREALFSILGDRCDDAQVLDLCAGTGSLGLEAMSRGAQSAILVEQNRKVAAILEENIRRVNLPNVRLEACDAFKLFPRLKAEGRCFDLVLTDPPYKKNLGPALIEALCKAELLSHKGIVVVEHLAESLPDIKVLELTDRRRYGSTALSFYEPKTS